MERLIRLLAANRDIKIQERRDTGDEYSEDEVEKEQVQEKQEEEEKDRFPAAVSASGLHSGRLTASFNAARATNFRNSRTRLRRKTPAPAIRRVVKGMILCY